MRRLKEIDMLMLTSSAREPLIYIVKYNFSKP